MNVVLRSEATSEGDLRAFTISLRLVRTEIDLAALGLGDHGVSTTVSKATSVSKKRRKYLRMGYAIGGVHERVSSKLGLVVTITGLRQDAKTGCYGGYEEVGRLQVEATRVLETQVDEISSSDALQTRRGAHH